MRKVGGGNGKVWVLFRGGGYVGEEWARRMEGGGGWRRWEAAGGKVWMGILKEKDM